MATHLVITHTIELKNGGGPRDQAAVLASLNEPLTAIEVAVAAAGGDTKFEAPTKTGPRVTKIIPAAPAPQSAPDPVPEPVPEGAVGQASQDPAPFPASRRGHGGEPKTAA